MADEIIKYQGAVTGPETDAAILDMANHTSERYAKGTAGGVAVTAGSVGYQDNAKYYKDQATNQVALAAAAATRAENAATRAESAVPAGTDAAVLYTQAQALSDSEQSQARANIKAGGSNRNLLDNPWFTVNQRGANGAIALNTYGLDRWRSLNAACVMQTGQISGGTAGQYINDILSVIVGKTVTVSAIVNGVVETATISLPSNAYTTVLSSADIQIDIDTSATAPRFIFTPKNGAVVTAVKLELGSYSTLANDAPPNYAEELTKCQLYCRALKFAGASYFTMAYNAAATVARFSLPFTMRAVPSLTFSGTFTILSGGSEHAISGFSVTGNTNDVIPISATTTGLTTNETGLVKAESGSVIILSADL